MDLETMIGAETDPAAESLRGMLAQAKMELQDANSKLQMAMDDAADETVIADLRQDVTDAEKMRDNYKRMLDTAKADLVTVTGERDTARTDLAEFKTIAAGLLTEAALKEKIAREKAISDAISMGDNGDNRVGTDAKAVPDIASGVAESGPIVKRNAAGMVTVDVNGATDDVYTGGETTAVSGDWNSVTMTRTDANDAEHTLVIYTDIDAPADVPIKTRYTDADENLLDNALMIVDTATDLRVGKAQSDGFPSGPGDTWEYGPDGRAKTVLGTFDGVPGQFECIPEMCMVTADKKGKLTSSAGWRFTP